MLRDCSDWDKKQNKVAQGHSNFCDLQTQMADFIVFSKVLRSSPGAYGGTDRTVLAILSKNLSWTRKEKGAEVVGLKKHN